MKKDIDKEIVNNISIIINSFQTMTDLERENYMNSLMSSSAVRSFASVLFLIADLQNDINDKKNLGNFKIFLFHHS